MNNNRQSPSPDWVAYQSASGEVIFYKNSVTGEVKWATTLHARPAVDIDTDEELARVAAWILHKCKNTPGITSEQIVKLFGSASRHLNEKLHLKPENERQEAISRVRDLVDKIITSRQVQRLAQPHNQTLGTINRNSGVLPMPSRDQQNVERNSMPSQIQTVGELLTSQGYKIRTIIVPPHKHQTQPLTHVSSQRYVDLPTMSSYTSAANPTPPELHLPRVNYNIAQVSTNQASTSVQILPTQPPVYRGQNIELVNSTNGTFRDPLTAVGVTRENVTGVEQNQSLRSASVAVNSYDSISHFQNICFDKYGNLRALDVTESHLVNSNKFAGRGHQQQQSATNAVLGNQFTSVIPSNQLTQLGQQQRVSSVSSGIDCATNTRKAVTPRNQGQDQSSLISQIDLTNQNTKRFAATGRTVIDKTNANSLNPDNSEGAVTHSRRQLQVTSYERMLAGALPFRHSPTLQTAQEDASVPRCATVDYTTTNREASDQRQRIVRMNGNTLNPGVLINTTPLQEELDLLPRVASVISLAPQTRETVIWRMENTAEKPSNPAAENITNRKVDNALLHESDPFKIKIEQVQEDTCVAENGSSLAGHSSNSTTEQTQVSTVNETLNYIQAEERGFAAGPTRSNSVDSSDETNQSSVAPTGTYPVQNIKTEPGTDSPIERPAEITESVSPASNHPQASRGQVHDFSVKIKTEPVSKSATEEQQECGEQNGVDINSSETVDTPQTDNVTVKTEPVIDPVDQPVAHCSTSSDCNEVSLSRCQISDNDLRSIEKLHSDVDSSVSVEKSTDFHEATTTPLMSSIHVKIETSNEEHPCSDKSALSQSSVCGSGLNSSITDRDEDATLSQRQKVDVVHDSLCEGGFSTKNTVGNTACDENDRVDIFSVLQVADSQASATTLESSQRISTLDSSFQCPSSNKSTYESPAADDCMTNEQCSVQLPFIKSEINSNNVATTSNVEFETNTRCREMKVECVGPEENEVEFVEVSCKSSNVNCPVIEISDDSDENDEAKDSDTAPLPMYSLLDYLPGESEADYCCNEEATNATTEGNSTFQSLVTENNSDLETDSIKIERKRKMEDSSRTSPKKHKKQAGQDSNETKGESDRHSMNLHMQHDCSICGKSFVEEESLELHQLEHTFETPLHCRHCEVSFLEFADLARHSCITLNSSSLHGKQCHASLTEPVEFQEHDCVASQDNLLHCETCDGDFTNPNDLENRDCNQPRRRPLHCKYCDKTFSKSRNLLRHLSQHGVKNTLLQKSLLEAGELSHNMRPRGKTKKKLKGNGKTNEVGKNVNKVKNKGKMKRNEKEKRDKERREAEMEQENEENEPLRTGENSTIEVNPPSDKFSCEKCGKTFKNEAMFTRHQQRHMEPKEFRCEQCSKSYDTLSELNIHVQKHSAEKPFKCEHCPKAFRLASRLSVHRSKHTGEDPLKCEHCGKKFMETKNLVGHLQRFHTGEKEYECPHCNKAFVVLEELERHKRTHEKPYQCEECDKRFSELTHLTVHQRRHTGEKPFACDLCDKCYSREVYLNVHKVRKHGDGKADIYHCSTCSKSFSNDDELKTHLETHSLKTFKCEYCGDEFQLSVLLKRHLRKDHQKNGEGNGDFKCKRCHERFANSYRLQRHSATHTGKTVECPKCDKLFFDNSDMKKHFRTHTGERPYKCTKCCWAFSQSSQLYKHLQNVHGESTKKVSDDPKKNRGHEKLVCDNCPREFRDIAHLKRHFLTHTGEKPYKCKLCSSSFREKHHLSRHLKSFHSDQKAVLETGIQGDRQTSADSKEQRPVTQLDGKSLLPSKISPTKPPGSKETTTFSHNVQKPVACNTERETSLKAKTSKLRDRSVRLSQEAENPFFPSKSDCPLPSSVKSRKILERVPSIQKPTPTQATDPLRKSQLSKDKTSSSSHDKRESPISSSFASATTATSKTAQRISFQSDKNTVRVQKSKPTSLSTQSSSSSCRRTLRKSLSAGNANQSGEIDNIVDKMLQQKTRQSSSQHRNKKVQSEKNPKRFLKLIEPLPLPLSLGGKMQTPPPSPRKAADKYKISPSKMSELKRTMEMRQQLSKGMCSQPDDPNSPPAETQTTSVQQKQDLTKPPLHPETIDHSITRLKFSRSKSLPVKNCGESIEFTSSKRRLLPESEAKTKKRFTLKDLADRVNNQSFSSSKDETLKPLNIFEQLLEEGFPKVSSSLGQPVELEKMDTSAKLEVPNEKVTSEKEVQPCYSEKLTYQQTLRSSEAKGEAMQLTLEFKSAVDTFTNLKTCEAKTSVENNTEYNDQRRKTFVTSEHDSPSRAMQHQVAARNESPVSSSLEILPTKRKGQKTLENGKKNENGLKKYEVERCTDKDSSVLTNNNVSEPSQHGEDGTVNTNLPGLNDVTSESPVKCRQTSSIKNASGILDNSEALVYSENMRCSPHNSTVTLTPKSDQPSMNDTTDISSGEIDSSQQSCEVTSALEVPQQLVAGEKEKEEINENQFKGQARKSVNVECKKEEGELVEEEQVEQRKGKERRMKEDAEVEEKQKAIDEIEKEEQEKQEDHNSSAEKEAKGEQREAKTTHEEEGKDKGEVDVGNKGEVVEAEEKEEVETEKQLNENDGEVELKEDGKRQEEEKMDGEIAGEVEMEEKIDGGLEVEENEEEQEVEMEGEQEEEEEVDGEVKEDDDEEENELQEENGEEQNEEVVEEEEDGEDRDKVGEMEEDNKKENEVEEEDSEEEGEEAEVEKEEGKEIEVEEEEVEEAEVEEEEVEEAEVEEEEGEEAEVEEEEEEEAEVEEEEGEEAEVEEDEGEEFEEDKEEAEAELEDNEEQDEVTESELKDDDKQREKEDNEAQEEEEGEISEEEREEGEVEEEDTDNEHEKEAVKDDDEAEVVESSKVQSAESIKVEGVATSSLCDEGSSAKDSSSAKMKIKTTKVCESNHQCSEVSSSVEKSPQLTYGKTSPLSKEITKKSFNEVKKTSPLGQTPSNDQNQFPKRQDQKARTTGHVNNKLSFRGIVKSTHVRLNIAPKECIPEQPPADTNHMRNLDQPRFVEGRGQTSYDRRNSRPPSYTSRKHTHKREQRSRSPVCRERTSPLSYSGHTKRPPADNGHRRPSPDPRSSVRPRSQRSPYRYRSSSRERERRRNVRHPSNERLSSPDSRDKRTQVHHTNDPSLSKRPRTSVVDSRDSRPPKRRKHWRSSPSSRKQKDSKYDYHKETPTHYSKRRMDSRRRDIPSLLPRPELEHILFCRNSFVQMKTGQHSGEDRRTRIPFQRDERPQSFDINNIHHPLPPFERAPNPEIVVPNAHQPQSFPNQADHRPEVLSPNSHQVLAQTQPLPLPNQNGQRPASVDLNNSREGPPVGPSRRPSFANEHGNIDQRPRSPNPDRGHPSLNNGYFRQTFPFHQIPPIPCPPLPLPPNFVRFPPFANPWQR